MNTFPLRRLVSTQVKLKSLLSVIRPSYFNVVASKEVSYSKSQPMDFYYVEASPPCRAVMLTAKAVGVSMNKKTLDLLQNEHMKPEFLAINPQHCVPTLVDGDLTLWESRAICTYLVSQYANDETLYPTNPKIRAQIDKLLYFDIGTLYRRFSEYVHPVIFLGGKPDPEKLSFVHEALSWFNDFLSGHEYCVGNSISVADYVLIANVSSFIEIGICFSKYPNITAWVERCKAKMVGYEEENGVGAKIIGQFVKTKFAEAEL